jgi:hypothetical protein
MSFIADEKYPAKVVDAFMVESSKKGTMGICFTFSCEPGHIETTRWLTENTSDRVLKDLETLGFSKEMLSDPDNLDRIGEILKDRECEIVPEWDDYKKKMVVKWINSVGGVSRTTGPGVRDRMHALLTGNAAPLVSAPRQRTPPAAPPAPPPAEGIDEQDVPF